MAGGGISEREVAAGLAQASCPKLTSFSAFVRCGYRKAAHQCSEPRHFRRCPLPKHDLRNGRLNQTAYSLRLFLRDRCNDDLVGWIDEQLASAEPGPRRTRQRRRLRALLGPDEKTFFGVSRHRSLSMALSDPHALATLRLETARCGSKRARR